MRVSSLLRPWQGSAPSCASVAVCGVDRPDAAPLQRRRRAPHAAIMALRSRKLSSATAPGTEMLSSSLVRKAHNDPQKLS